MDTLASLGAVAMNIPFQESDGLLPDDEQKRLMDEVIVLFSRQKISLAELYNQISRITLSHHDSLIFSHAHNDRLTSQNPVHIP